MKALAASREKRSLALLAPWHQAEARGRQSERSQASPAQGPPDKAHAMRQTALFQRAGGRPRPANDGATGAQATARGWPASAPGPGRSAGSLIGTARNSNRSGETCRKDGRISAFIQHLDQANGMLEASTGRLQADEGEAFIRSGDTGGASPSLVPTLFLGDTAGHVSQHKLTERFFRVSALPLK